MKRFIPCRNLCVVALVLILGSAVSAAPLGDVATTDSPTKEAATKGGAKKGRAKRDDAKKDETKKDDAKPDAAKADQVHEGAAQKESPKAQLAKKDQQDGSPRGPATYKVKKGPLRIEVTLDGVFEAQTMTEVALRPQEWTAFEVLKAVEHGAKVRQGDLLAALDTEKIDRAIADLKREQTLAQLALQESQLQLQSLQVSAPLDLASSQRGKRVADEDLDYFLKVGRSASDRNINFSVKTAEDQLAYEQEELRQLEKMYKADDLVEETEEIILKRARDNVERAKFMLEMLKTNRDLMLKTTLPRSEESLKHSVQRQALELTKTQATLPFTQRRLELTLEKMKLDSARNEEKLKKLTADRAAMTVKAPSAGVAYYGRCVRGKWMGGDAAAEKLRRGGRLAGDEVFMTIVETRPMSIRTAVPEKQLQHVTPGLKGTARPAGYPDMRLTAILQRIDAVPSSSKEFDARITVALDDEAKALMPGMTCEVKLVAYQKGDAITVPASAVATDPQDETKHYVYLLGKKGKPQKREATLGKRTEKRIEILKGLAEGDEILLECPQDMP